MIKTRGFRRLSDINVDPKSFLTSARYFDGTIYR